MKLTYKKVPQEFLSLLPEGIKFVNKHGRDFLIIEKICCPRGHSLMVESVKIHGEASVRIKVKINDVQGLIFIDPFWGGHDKLFSFFPAGGVSSPVVRAFCPVCDADMVVKADCVYQGCDSDEAIVLALPGGKNKIYACARVGCPGHHMALVDLNEEMVEQVDEINYFGSHDDDIFQGV